MLRITRVESHEAPTVKLEGKLLGPWTDEVRSACREQASEKPVRLDLSALTYVDAEGLRLLSELLAAGGTVSGCSQFVASLLKEASHD
jgi:anti-anti-sigma regulatory factor